MTPLSPGGATCPLCGRPIPVGYAKCDQCRSSGQNSTGCLIAVGVAAFAILAFMVVVVGAIWWVRARAVAVGPTPTPPPAFPIGPGPGRATSPSRAAGSGGSDIVSWVGNPSGAMCFADADGDGVPELIGYGTALMALNVKSGNVVWTASGAGRESNAALYCDGHASVVVYRAADFTVVGLDPRSGNERWSAKLSDKLEGISFGDGCLVATATDRTSLDLDARTGAKKGCSPIAAPTKRHRRGDAIHAGDLEIHAAESAGPGTRRMVVRATRGAATAWETTLPTMEASREAAIGALPGGIYVAGKKHGGQGLVVAMLNPRSGAIVVTREDASVQKADSFFMKVATTEHAVLVESFGMLHVYDARELTPLWWAGTMWATR